jgi:hypothetical protein
LRCAVDLLLVLMLVVCSRFSPALFLRSAATQRCRGKLNYPISRAVLAVFAHQRLFATAANDMPPVDTTQRLADLRRLMKERKVDVYSWSNPLARPVAPDVFDC